MHRIDTPFAEADKHGTGKDGFTNGDPLLGVPDTELDADFFDALQEEIANVVEGVGAALVKGTNTQLKSAVDYPLRLLGLNFRAETQDIGAGVYPRAVACRDAYANASAASWVAVGDDGAGNGKIWSSFDGKTWTLRATTGTGFKAVAWNAAQGLFVAVGLGGSIRTSADGITWASPGSGTAADLYGVACDDTTWVVVGHGVVRTSADGTTWGAGGAFSTLSRAYAVAYGSKGRFIAVGYGATHWKVDYSDDAGTTWSACVVPVIGNGTQPGFRSIFEAPDRTWVAVGWNETGGLYTSEAAVSLDDGATFTASELNIPNNILAETVIHDGGIWIVVCNTGLLLFSLDGSDNSWRQFDELGSSTGWAGIARHPTLHRTMIVASGGWVTTSIIMRTSSF